MPGQILKGQLAGVQMLVGLMVILQPPVFCWLGLRTLTIGGRITVQLVSSLTRLELPNEGNIILFVFSEAV